MGPKNRPANGKKSYFCWWRKSWLFFLITLFMNMKNWTILLFSGSLSKICCTKLDLLQDIRKFYGALFDVHRFLKYERRHQSVAFNSLATQWVTGLLQNIRLQVLCACAAVSVTDSRAWLFPRTAGHYSTIDIHRSQDQTGSRRARQQ